MDQDSMYRGRMTRWGYNYLIISYIYVPVALIIYGWIISISISMTIGVIPHLFIQSTSFLSHPIYKQTIHLYNTRMNKYLNSSSN